MKGEERKREKRRTHNSEPTTPKTKVKNAYGNGYYANEEAKHETLTFQSVFCSSFDFGFGFSSSSICLSLSLSPSFSSSLPIGRSHKFVRIKRCFLYVWNIERDALGIVCRCRYTYYTRSTTRCIRFRCVHCTISTRSIHSPAHGAPIVVIIIQQQRQQNHDAQQRRRQEKERNTNIIEPTDWQDEEEWPQKLTTLHTDENVLFSRFVKCLCKLEIINVEYPSNSEHSVQSTYSLGAHTRCSMAHYTQKQRNIERESYAIFNARSDGSSLQVRTTPYVHHPFESTKRLHCKRANERNSTDEIIKFNRFWRSRGLTRTHRFISIYSIPSLKSETKTISQAWAEREEAKALSCHVSLCLWFCSMMPTSELQQHHQQPYTTINTIAMDTYSTLLRSDVPCVCLSHC